MSLQQVTRSVWANPGNRGRRLRKSCEAVRWQLEKRLTGRPRVLRLANGVLFKAYPDCVVSSGLVYADWPEYAELAFVRRCLAPRDLVIDVGAYVGHISLLLADIVGGDRVIAFEPAPASYARLVENWALNGWEPGRLYRSAVGAARGRAFMPNPARPLPTNRVVTASGASGAGMVEVPVIPLDDCEQLWRGRRVGLLKIDVEGDETEVFRGATRLLTDTRPRLIMFESLGGRLHPDIGAQLQAWRYVAFGIDEDGRPAAARLSGQNLFAVPEEGRHAIR